MSGQKRIVIDQSEWLRVQREAARVARVDEALRDVPEVVDSIRRRIEADLTSMADDIDQRQQAAEQAVAGLSEQARELERETNRRLHRMAETTAESIRSHAGQLRQETRDLIARQEVAWRTELTAERQLRREQMNALSAQVKSFADERDRAMTAAQTWLHDAGRLRGLIRSTLPHERFAPGDLEAIERRLGSAEATLAQGQHQAALAVAQGAYHDLGDLRVTVELQDRQWRLTRTMVTESLLSIATLIDHHTVRPVFDEQGRPVPEVTLDVDFWSWGELAKLKADVGEQLERVRQDTSLTSQQLQEIAEQDVARFEQRLGAVLQGAVERQLASQVRVNVADVVVETLDQVAGYELVPDAAGYAAGDQRGAFLAKLRHQNGDEIVVTVSPGEDDTSGCVLRLHSFDRSGSTVDQQSRARQVSTSLRALGLDSGDATSEAPHADPAMRDVERAVQPVTRPTQQPY